jgi:pimeloyl-ACP methyl ester carboxylesterase
VTTDARTPIVMIPGIQGRWEWMQPAVAELRRRRRVYTFSLGGSSVFESAMEEIDDIVSREQLESVAVIGVSFGGLIAANYAAQRAERVSSLVLVSTPSPRWRLDPRAVGYLQRPWLATPVLLMGGARRLLREVSSSRDGIPGRVASFAAHVGRVVRHPASPARIAGWVREWQDRDLVTGCANITAPTLTITGEPTLDRVVKVHSTLEYLDLIPGARHATLPRTGHLGLITRPAEFARLVEEFVDAPHHSRADRSA